MANNKKKVDIIYKKKTENQHLSESYEIYDDEDFYWPSSPYDDPDFIFYDYTYTQDGVKVCVTDDPNKIRQDKIDSILGEKSSMSRPTIDNILPNSLRNKDK